MANKNVESPVQLLVAICEMGEANQVIKVLEEKGNFFHFVSLSCGTTGQENESWFAFGIHEREVVFSLVLQSDAEWLVQTIASQMEMENAKRGMVFTTNLSGIEKEFYQAMGKGGKDGNKK